MSLISLKNSSETEVTVLSNRFIDNFMPRANGEFVKVYIYLLRWYLQLLLLLIWRIWQIVFFVRTETFPVP